MADDRATLGDQLVSEIRSLGADGLSQSKVDEACRNILGFMRLLAEINKEERERPPCK
jgi:hypothetical protein